MVDIQQREVLIHVKLLASIKQGQKVNTRYLYVQDDTYITKLSRYMYSENRNNTVYFVRRAMDQAIALVKKEELKESLTRDIQLAVIGIGNLIQTYQDSIRITAELTEILEMVNRAGL